MLRILLAIVGAWMVASCSSGAKTCDPASCSGCCDSRGECQPGSSQVQCGHAGAVCRACVLAQGEVCLNSQCQTASAGGGTGGGDAGGSAAGGGGDAGGSAAGGGTAAGGGAAGGGAAGGGAAGGGAAGGGAAGGGAAGGGTAITCTAGSTSCTDDATLLVCDSTGVGTISSCLTRADGGADPGGQCFAGRCLHDCLDAEQLGSSMGCVFWSSVQDNAIDAFFRGGTTSGQGVTISEFGFVAVNGFNAPVSITVQRFSGTAVQTVLTATAPPRSDPSRGMAVVRVPWQSISPSSITSGLSNSGLARYGYRVTASRPINLYQLNPVGTHTLSTKVCTSPAGTRDCTCNQLSTFQAVSCTLDPSQAGLCTDAGTSNRCSYDNYSSDGSLLLPEHLLGTDYVAASRQQTAVAATADGGGISQDSNGTLSVVATRDGTQVTVTSTAATLAGTGVAAMAKQETRVFTLNSFDVLQLASGRQGPVLQCAPNPFDNSPFGPTQVCRLDNDLTGTHIVASAPVAVFGGASCAMSPFDRAACDHLEEQVPPTSSWGKTFVGVHSAPVRLGNNTFATKAPDVWKVVVGCSAAQCPIGALLTFSNPPAVTEVLPPNRCLVGSLTSNNCRLPAGASMEFKRSVDFTLTSDQPVALLQFFPGAGTGTTATDPAEGDPSMVLTPPVERWRARYRVVASPGVAHSYLGLALQPARVQQLRVDGVDVPLSGFVPIPFTGFSVKNHPIAPGAHDIEVISNSGAGAGVTVYGYDSFVSYGYVGGL